MTRRIGLAAVLTAPLISAIAAWLPYRAIPVQGAPAPAPPYFAPTGVAGLRLHVFNTGMNRMSSLLVGAERPWRPAPAFVLEHPREGLVVFDCGLSPEVAREGESALSVPVRWLIESRGHPDRTLERQMREAGLAPERVRTVVISHLHEDHTGAARFFSQAEFVGGAGAAGHALPGGFEPVWREPDFVNAEAASPPFEPGIDLFDDGSVRVLRGGGHTEEDLLLWIALPLGPVLLAGDAVVHFDWLESDDVQRIAADADRAADVRNRVRALLAAGGTTVLPGHDLRRLPRDRADLVLHHPEWLDPRVWPIESGR